MNGMLNYWQGLSSREKWLLGGGALLVIILLLYVTVWEPWQTRLSYLRGVVPTKQVELARYEADLNRLAPQLAKRQKNRADQSVPLLTLIEKTAGQTGLRDAIRQIQPDQNDQVTVRLSKAGFDKWLQWVESLKSQGIEIVSATINRSEDNLVSVRVTFDRA